jgi:hypothetical protein
VTLVYGIEAAADVEQMIMQEKECCAFLVFDTHPGENIIELTITVPEQMAKDANALLAPFTEGNPPPDSGFCCDTCSMKKAIEPVHTGRLAGAAMGSSAAAVLACSACCVLPLMFPAIAASASGGIIAWLAGAHHGITAAASVIVVIAWLWVWRESAKRKARPAAFTLTMMSLASISLIAALVWPRVEAFLVPMLVR